MKVDITKIPGYENMTAEEKIAALEGYDIPEVKAANDSDEVKKLKQMISERNGEVADYKRKWQATLDESQRAEIDRQEELNALREQNAALVREKQTKEYVANFLNAGYSAELAEASAKAMIDGDTASVFAHLGTFLETQKKSIEAAALNQQPTISSGVQPAANIIDEQEQARLRKYFGL